MINSMSQTCPVATPNSSRNVSETKHSRVCSEAMHTEHTHTHTQTRWGRFCYMQWRKCTQYFSQPRHVVCCCRCCCCCCLFVCLFVLFLCVVVVVLCVVVFVCLFVVLCLFVLFCFLLLLLLLFFKSVHVNKTKTIRRTLLPVCHRRENNLVTPSFPTLTHVSFHCLPILAHFCCL